MAFDEKLANRIRSELASRADIVEKPMFGGLAFLAGGHIVVAASRTGALLARVHSAAERDSLLREGSVSPMIRETTMIDRFVYVSAESIASKRALRGWIERSSHAVAARYGEERS